MIARSGPGGWATWGASTRESQWHPVPSVEKFVIHLMILLPAVSSRFSRKLDISCEFSRAVVARTLFVRPNFV